MERPLHEATLRDYVRVVFRRKLIVLTCLAVVPLAAVGLSLRQPPLYNSSADVLLLHENLAGDLSGVSQADLNSYYPTRFAETQVRLAETPILADRVVRAAKVRSLGLTPGAFLGSASVSADPNADLLTFSVTNRDPHHAALLATAYANQYTIYRQEVDTESIRRALADVNTRIAQLQAKGDRASLAYARTLSNRAEQLRTLQELRTANARVIRPAESATKVQPRPVRYGILGLVLGFVLGFGLAFLAEALDTRVRKAEEIADVLHMPLLARIAEPPRRLQRDKKFIISADPNGSHAEAFRLMRTNLEFVNLDRHARVIMVTSAHEGEGKSTTAANLAVALGWAGRSVALVDLDLRKPSLQSFFRANKQPGLTDVVLGRCTLDHALQTVVSGSPTAPADENGHGSVAGVVELLSVGQPPPNPGEFAGGQAVKAILDELATRADFVIVDVPPLLHVGDALSVAKRVDGLILVTRLRVVKRPTLGELRRILDACPADLLGFVLAGATADEGYGYGTYEYYRAPKHERDSSVGVPRVDDVDALQVGRAETPSRLRLQCPSSSTRFRDMVFQQFGWRRGGD